MHWLWKEILQNIILMKNPVFCILCKHLVWIKENLSQTHKHFNFNAISASNKRKSLCMANLPWPVLNIRCFPLGGNRASTMSHQSAPLPHYRQPSPHLYGSVTCTIWKRTLVWLNYHTYVKKLWETCMVEEPSHVKPLSLNHPCKIGLIILWHWSIS